MRFGWTDRQMETWKDRHKDRQPKNIMPSAPYSGLRHNCIISTMCPPSSCMPILQCHSRKFHKEVLSYVNKYHASMSASPCSQAWPAPRPLPHGREPGCQCGQTGILAGQMWSSCLWMTRPGPEGCLVDSFGLSSILWWS